MSSMVLEMPVMVTAKPEQERALQNRLVLAYDGLFAQVKQQYRIHHEEQVFTFLRQHSQLLPILTEGREAVSLFFGDDTPILLTWRRDSEIGLEHLVAWIQTTLPAGEAVDRWLAFCDAWFSHRLDVVGDLLDFNPGGRP